MLTFQPKAKFNSLTLVRGRKHLGPVASSGSGLMLVPSSVIGSCRRAGGVEEGSVSMAEHAAVLLDAPGQELSSLAAAAGEVFETKATL